MRESPFGNHLPGFEWPLYPASILDSWQSQSQFPRWTIIRLWISSDDIVLLCLAKSSFSIMMLRFSARLPISSRPSHWLLHLNRPPPLFSCLSHFLIGTLMNLKRGSQHKDKNIIIMRKYNRVISIFEINVSISFRSWIRSRTTTIFFSLYGIGTFWPVQNRGIEIVTFPFFFRLMLNHSSRIKWCLSDRTAIPNLFI